MDLFIRLGSEQRRRGKLDISIWADGKSTFKCSNNLGSPPIENQNQCWVRATVVNVLGPDLPWPNNGRTPIRG